MHTIYFATLRSRTGQYSLSSFPLSQLRTLGSGRFDRSEDRTCVCCDQYRYLAVLGRPPSTTPGSPYSRYTPEMSSSAVSWLLGELYYLHFAKMIGRSAWDPLWWLPLLLPRVSRSLTSWCAPVRTKCRLEH